MTAGVANTASWRALGTTALVRVADPGTLNRAAELLKAEVARIDRVASSYRTDSELTALNAAAGRMLAVSAGLREAVAVAIGAAQASDGMVDPTLGADPGWRAIRIGSWALGLPLGTRLDLGATAKALAADRAAGMIAREIDGRGVLVSLGGDIATAGEAPAEGWLIHVTDDHRSGPDADGQTVAIRRGGLATSGTTARRASIQGGVRVREPAAGGPCDAVRCGGVIADHHIIDPRTGRSADSPWRTVSATAASCVDANTVTTAAIVLGTEAPGWLETQGVAARLVANDGAVTRLGGWPA